MKTLRDLHLELEKENQRLRRRAEWWKQNGDRMIMGSYFTVGCLIVLACIVSSLLQ